MENIIVLGGCELIQQKESGDEGSVIKNIQKTFLCLGYAGDVKLSCLTKECILFFCKPHGDKGRVFSFCTVLGSDTLYSCRTDDRIRLSLNSSSGLHVRCLTTLLAFIFLTPPPFFNLNVFFAVFFSAVKFDLLSFSGGRLSCTVYFSLF